MDLSPNVTPFRKGKGPKRVRCASYFDGDVLPGLSPRNVKNDESEVKEEEKEERREVLAELTLPGATVKVEVELEGVTGVASHT